MGCYKPRGRCRFRRCKFGCLSEGVTSLQTPLHRWKELKAAVGLRVTAAFGSRWTRAALGLLVTGAVLAGEQACQAKAGSAADSVARFYRGKTVTVLVGFGPGGGYDLYARTLARHIGRYIPGQPTVIVQNMPGAGGIVAANYLYNVAPKDGTVFGIFDPNSLFEQLVGYHPERFRSDPTRFHWLGSMSEEVHVCLARSDAGFRRFQDLRQRTLRVGSSGSGSVQLHPLLLNGILGTRLGLVVGYQGTNEIALAVERGEIQGLCGFPWSSVKSTRPEWVEGGQMTVLVQMGLRKHPDLEAVPLVLDLAPDEEARSLLEVAFTPSAFARPFVAPPGVPAERVKALREAFRAAVRDPRLRQDARAANLDLYNPASGEDVQRLVQRMMSAPAHQVQRLAGYVKGL